MKLTLEKNKNKTPSNKLTI